jgi:serpin B
MKQFIYLSMLILIPIIATHAQSPNNEVTKTLKSISVPQANNRLAFDLYKKLSVTNIENLFFSPFSIYSALALTYSGAGGNTKTEIQQVINITGNDTAFYRKFSEINKVINNAPVDINNAAWVYNKLNLQEAYVNNLKNFFAADLKKTDFVNSPGKSCNEINEWVSEKTHGKINNALAPADINLLTRLIITNTIYFNAEWQKKFDKDFTQKNVFYNYGSEKDSVWFMRDGGEYRYYEDELLQALKIPYQYSNYSLVIFLPRHKDSIAQVESVMNNKKYEEYMNALYTCLVSVSIPKFKFNTQYDLKGVLSASGMPTAFLPAADFSGITADDKLKIDKISHSAFIEVNEERTEAAASTLTEHTTSSASIKLKTRTFRANSPFLFMINYHDHDTNLILFMGKIQKLN